VGCDVSIIIPVFNQLEFTEQCLQRIWRNTAGGVSYEVIVVDNGSTDRTAEWFADHGRFRNPVKYQRQATNVGFARANNLGARLSEATRLLFLNNDTLVQPGWLSEMVAVGRADPSVGIVGIKQLFPYTDRIYHTGIVFGPEGRPEHLYPHLEASLPQVNKQREYQAVTGACLLIDRALFDDCGGFDESYLNGYEDVDLCLRVRQRGKKVVCCTNAFIYHYGQMTEGRASADDRNAALFQSRWSGRIRADRDEYLIRDRVEIDRASRPVPAGPRTLADDCVYLADDLARGSALSWINAELALALHRRGTPVFINGAAALSTTLSAEVRRELASLALDKKPVGGVQIKWSHYWSRHMNLELAGVVNAEFFVINYLFNRPGDYPWDIWLQCLRQNRHAKLPLSGFCKDVLVQIGVPELDCHIWYPGYSREIAEREGGAPAKGSRFRFLTVTNSHDLQRYNTQAIVQAYRASFTAKDEVVLVIKDYGASSGDRTIRRMLDEVPSGAAIEYVSEFVDKRDLIRLYKSSDAFVSAHRGEGFGMKILDAMACGIPVIAPLFGGPTAFCRPDNCLPVEFSQVPMGDCLDTRSLRIPNEPMWAEVDVHSLGRQMRRTFDDRAQAAAVGAAGRSSVIDRFSWDSAATRLLEVIGELQVQRPAIPQKSRAGVAPSSASPYWLGLRVTVVIPTHNRKERLVAGLDALTRQSILHREFEVLVIDDGSTDGTKEAVESRSDPFALRYHWQANAGPGAARNLGIELATGEFVLFIGDDIVADERLLEEHLLAHAASPGAEVAILGRIDWPAGAQQNTVMQWVGGEATQQFAYDLVRRLTVLDHRFFYTSNISLKRQFLVDAAQAGVRFDPDFRHAAFEDTEFALRLVPRGLRILYADSARAAHDHPMDLNGFARREFGAGEMSVVFYRKHPGQDDQLQVAWLAELVEPAAALLTQPDLLRHLTEFDLESDTLLRTLTDSLKGSLVNPVLRVIFDVERTRGKVQEWYSMVQEPAKVQAAQTLASVMRKIEFFNFDAKRVGLPSLNARESQPVESLRQRIGELEGVKASRPGRRLRRRRAGQALRRLMTNSRLLPRLLAADQFVQDRLRREEAWLSTYLRLRRRLRDKLL